jgi:hypothetical protein
MSLSKLLSTFSLAETIVGSLSSQTSRTKINFRQWVPTPPLGWNNCDCLGSAGDFVAFFQTQKGKVYKLTATK